MPNQTVNFERSNNQSDGSIIFIKHNRMVVDVDGRSQNSNVYLFPVSSEEK